MSLAGVPFLALLEGLGAQASAADTAAAIGVYRAWLAANPSAPEAYAAWFNLGAALAASGDRKSAAHAYQQSLAARPHFHAAAVNLGLLLESAGEAQAAYRTWQAALQPAEARCALLNHMGRLREQENCLVEAERLYRDSLAADPAQPDVLQHWTHVRQKLCLWPVLDETIGLPRATLATHLGPLGTLALRDDIAAQRRAGESWVARKTAPQPRLSPPGGYRHGKLRLGYLAADYCRHPTSLLVAELIERHDRSRFEVVGYDASPDDGSDTRARILRGFDRVVPVRALPDAAVAAAIRADEIDVLIDLNGLTAGGRLAVLRWRPAPVQATFLGFVGPVPLPELDALFCDDRVIPPALAKEYWPTPWPVAPLYQPNDRLRAPGPATTRRAEGLPDDAPVFCSFANHFKITETLFAAWMRILTGLPRAVLWLADDRSGSADNLRRHAATHGIDPARLIFAPRIDPAGYLARLAVADLFLDTFPYTSGTVASDAIRMGLPIVAIRGEAFAARMSARLLEAIDAEAGIASDHDDYVARALRHIGDPGYRGLFGEAAWRRTLGDLEGFLAAYEASLEDLHARLTAPPQAMAAD